MVKMRNPLVKLQLECEIAVETNFYHVQGKQICKTANKKALGDPRSLRGGRSVISSRKLETVKSHCQSHAQQSSSNKAR